MGRSTTTKQLSVPSSVRTPAVPSGRPFGTAVRALLSLAALFAVLFAVPYGLARLAGWPLPHAVPHLDQVTGGLRSTYVPDDVIVKALAAVCWLVWAQLVVSILLEVVAMVRGRRPVHLPMAGGSQRLAALLVGGVALLGTLPGLRAPLPAPAPLVVRPATVVTIDRHGVTDAGDHRLTRLVGGASAAAASVAQAARTVVRALPTYEVQRRDTLWDIAERHLADPLRWPEIADLNRGVVQPDGQALDDPNLIRPGWILRLPADAIGLVEPALVADAATDDIAAGPTAPPTGGLASEAAHGVRVVVVADSGDGSDGYAVRVIDDGGGRPQLAEGSGG